MPQKPRNCFLVSINKQTKSTIFIQTWLHDAITQKCGMESESDEITYCNCIRNQQFTTLTSCSSWFQNHLIHLCIRWSDNKNAATFPLFGLKGIGWRQRGNSSSQCLEKGRHWIGLDEKNGNEGSFLCRNRAEKLRKIYSCVCLLLSTAGTSNYMCLVSYHIVLLK